MTWKELDAQAGAVAARLRELGCARGDRVGCLLPNSLEWCIAFAAATKAELLFVPLNPLFGPRELTHIVEDSGCKVVVSTPELVVKLGAGDNDGLPDEPRLFPLADLAAAQPFQSAVSSTGDNYQLAYDEQDPVAICYTSGTTGLPKGAVHTHATISVMVTGLASAYQMTADETFLLVAPLAFTGGVICNLAVCLSMGAHIIVEKGFDPPRTLELLCKERVSAYGGAAIFWERLAALPEFEHADLTALKHGFTGGAPVTRELIAAFQRKGVGIRQQYGCTECCGGATIPPLEEAIRNPNSCGKPMLGLRLKVCDDDGQEYLPNTPGEIRLAGPQLMTGYWNNPEKTAEAYDGEWYLTGDIGLLNDDGSVVIVDRKKSMIISGGVNVYPAEVEKALSILDGVVEACVIGVPSREWGEEVVAVVHSGEELSEDSLIRQLKDDLGKYKAPKRIRFSDSPLPRTATGKIDRLRVPDLFAELA